MKNTKGITLVALVITIIILLILAGITIAQLTGSGLFENARLAEQKSKNAQEKEESILDDYENKIGEYIEASRDSVTISKEEYEELKNTVKTLSEKVTNLEEKSVKFIDYNNLLTTITTKNASWTATEDCVMIAELQSSAIGYSAYVYVDGISVLRYNNANSTQSIAPGVVFIKKGSVITTAESYGIYNIRIYGLQ